MNLSKIALRSMYSNKVRSFLTILGIAIGVALIFAVAITNQTIVSSFQDVVDDLSGSADLQINDVAGGPFNESIIDEVSETEGVSMVAPIIIKTSALEIEKESEFIRIVGVDPEIDKRFRKYRIEKGHFLTSKNEILLVDSWASERSIEIGEEISISGLGKNSRFKVKGLISKVGPGAVDNGAVGYITLDASQELYGLTDKVTQLDIKRSQSGETASIKRSLKSNLSSGLLVRRPSEKGASIEAATKGVMGAFGSFGNLALFIGAFVAFNTMMMSVSERLREIGSLRLIGASRGQVFKVIVFETVLFGVIGSTLGVILGQVLGSGLSREVAQIYDISVTRTTTPTNWALTAFAIGIVATFIAGLQPALRASRVAPLEILRLSVFKKGSWLERFGWVIGLILISIGAALFLSPLKDEYGTIIFSLSSGLLFLGASFFAILLVTILNNLLSPLMKTVFRHEGRMAKDSIDRGRSRTALAVITLLASLSMIIAAGELRLADNAFLNNWMASILPFDLSVRTPIPRNITDVNKHAPIDFGLKKKIEGVKGVGHVNPIKFEVAKGLNRDIFIITTEGDSWKHTSSLKFDEGDREKALLEFDDGGTVMISSTITSKHDLHVGDELELDTPAGLKSFRITGVFPEVANDGFTIYASRHDQLKYWGDDSVDGFDISLKEGADLEETRAGLENIVEGLTGVNVITGQDIRDEIKGAVDQFLAILNALVVIAVVVTALGIINTLAMSVYERIREIGILRALGSSRQQIMKMVIAEAAVIGTMGAILGVIVGLVISWTIVVIAHLVGGWKVPFIFPTPFLILAAFISLSVTVIASIYPARVAAKIDIVKAVQYE